ncbi:transcriptional regulator, LuxR family [Parafrankia sp. EAN1pec]|uniref:HTH domain-containing protein n=1 Tax=Parafrankia sp. (strain EAN1pec) TaxID=298653 RepID=UPI0000541D18|nr:transcriptional regulator, LuxR family [Frankia sp. EAN1pec]
MPQQLAAGARKGDLAAQYQVSGEAIRKIRRGRTWRTLDDVARTHCRRNHSYAEHGYTRSQGKRRCRKCRREYERGLRLTREEYLDEHAGHELRTRVNGTVYCLACWRGESDIDEVAVERAIAGEPPERMSIAERHHAIRRLHGKGPSAREIARRLSISSRTVQRHVALIREAAA